MSTRVTVRCTDCGLVELAPSGVHLTVYDAGVGSYYEFFCPKCYEHYKLPACEEIQALLMNADVDHSFEHVPLELLEVHDGPPLTVDDLMDLCLALRRQSRSIVKAARKQLYSST